MCVGRGAAGRSMGDRTLAQPMKPMLPRKLTSSARIDLNRFWNELEELVPCHMSQQPYPEADDADTSNAINENLDNERLERALQGAKGRC